MSLFLLALLLFASFTGVGFPTCRAHLQGTTPSSGHRRTAAPFARTPLRDERLRELAARAAS